MNSVSFRSTRIEESRSGASAKIPASAEDGKTYYSTERHFAESSNDVLFFESTLFCDS